MKNNNITKPIVLIGLMGCGKTTIGKSLSRKTGLKFVDSDDEILERSGCKTISEIFERDGEEFFREVERKTIKELLKNSQKEPIVLATGGGAFMNPKTRKNIKKYALSVWIKADIDILISRLSDLRNRPLLNKRNIRSKLENLMEERYPTYQTADLTIFSKRQRPPSVVKKILQEMEQNGYC